MFWLYDIERRALVYNTLSAYSEGSGFSSRLWNRLSWL